MRCFSEKLRGNKRKLINVITSKELDFGETGCVPHWINKAHPKLKLIQPELENEFANLLSVRNKVAFQWLKSHMKVKFNTTPLLLLS